MNLNPESKDSLPSPQCPEFTTKKFTKFQCSTCKIGFFYIKDLKLHLLDSEAPCINCPKCDKSYSTERALNQHYGKIHRKKRPAKCLICKKKFRNKYAVKFHKMQVHEKVTREKCQYCQKDYFNSYSLQRHLEVCRENHQD